MIEIKTQKELEQEAQEREDTRLAIEESSKYLCTLLNRSILRVFLDEPATPEKLVGRLFLLPEGALPDGKQEEMGQTLRGIEQRMKALLDAVHGSPSKIWRRYWAARAKETLELLSGKKKAS